MSAFKNAYLEHQLKRWMAPDAHRFIRPDWRRFVQPGSDLWSVYELYERKYRPDQPRVPDGSPEGGQWTSEGAASGRQQSPSTSDRPIQLASDITGFTRHGINRAISRGVSPSAILNAVVSPLQIIPQANGTTRYVGSGAVVVLNPAGRVVTVWGR